MTYRTLYKIEYCVTTILKLYIILSESLVKYVMFQLMPTNVIICDN